LPSAAHREFVLELPGRGIQGGAVHDALVAATAGHLGATLVTCDQRAANTYDRYRIRTELL